MSTVNRISPEAYNISTDVAKRITNEINLIFEIARTEILDCIENTKLKALTYKEDARRQALHCINEGGTQELLADIEEGKHPDSSETDNSQNPALSNKNSQVSQNDSHKTHQKTLEERIEHDKDNEEVIKENLHRYEAYISDCIKATDLIAFYDLFTTSQTTTLRSMHRRNPKEATEKAFEIIKKTSTANKYRRLLLALDEAGYPKVVRMLEGGLVPVPGGSRYRDTIRICAKHMFQQLNTTDVLPYLLSKGVINENDREEIQRTEWTESTGIAALELLALLPNRSKQWIKHFVDSLTESGHEDLAKLTMQHVTEAHPKVPDDLSFSSLQSR